ncbi:MAG: ABC transporter ATP-binding protein [Clostridiales bacterium]|jgi:NitT/TauT family transport system ATP-binding protein|nr:ABC transporter ATP-binding protein [Clostridiales bacterium]
MPDPKIEIKGLGRSFKSKESKDDFWALSGFDLTVEKGEFLAVVGPSGCGKSTLLDLVVGLSKASAGEILIDGKPISGPALDRGIVLQGYALFPWRTVKQNIEFGLEIKKVPKKERGKVAERFIKLVELEGFEDHYPHELSGGMQQRVAIARALAYDPEVLLMDEPFAAVDAQTREVMQDELLAIWEKTGKTILFVTHSIEEAVALSDRVAVMSKSPGTVKEVVNVALPRPRRIKDVRNTPAFRLATGQVWDLLQNKAHESEADDSAEAKSAKPSFDIGNEILPDAVI